MSTADPPTLDEQWQAKWRAKHAELCRTTATTSASDTSACASQPTTSTSSSSGDASTPQQADPSSTQPAGTPATREQQLTDQMREYVTEEVRRALGRLRRHGPLSPVRWLLGALASTTSFQNPLPFTGMSLLFHASRAAEALGFEQLDHVLPYAKVGRDWGGAAAQHWVAPRGLAVLHAACMPVFQLLHRLDDPLVVNALFKGFGVGVVAARHVLDGLIARQSVRHMVGLVEAAAVERHMEWVRAQLIVGPAVGAVAVVGEPTTEVAAAAST